MPPLLLSSILFPASLPPAQLRWYKVWRQLLKPEGLSKAILVPWANTTVSHTHNTNTPQTTRWYKVERQSYLNLGGWVYFQDTGLPGRDNRGCSVHTYAHTQHVVPGTEKRSSSYTPPTHVKREHSVTQLLSSYSHSQEARAPEVNTLTRLAGTYPLCRPILSTYFFTSQSSCLLCVCVFVYLYDVQYKSTLTITTKSKWMHTTLVMVVLM